jgi:D-tyrosyl-tRNA(Tyr) deacylase
MRAVAQRVSKAEVEVEGTIVGAIGKGLLVYLGAAKTDSDADVETMAEKLAGLRIFEDESGKMSRSVLDLGGGMLVVPQFTLFGDVRRGRRPSFDEAAHPDEARRLYEAVLTRLRKLPIPIETGRFRSHMLVRSEVDGPVTILIDTQKLF